MNHTKFLEMVKCNSYLLDSAIQKIIENENKYDKNNESTLIFHELSKTYKEKLCYEIVSFNGIEYMYYDIIKDKIEDLIGSLRKLQLSKDETASFLNVPAGYTVTPSVFNVYSRLSDLIIDNAAEDITTMSADIKNEFESNGDTKKKKEE